MSWSLNRFPVNPRADDALHALGRALYVATRFEEKCKFILLMASLEARLEARDAAARADPVATLNEIVAQLPRDRQLARTLSNLVHIGPVSPDEEATLTAARLARNAIAHDDASFSIHEQPGPTIPETVHGQFGYDLDQLRGALDRLRTHVRELASGDNLVSTWCFGIEEGRTASRPDQLIEAYEAMIERWVLAPVWDLLNDTSRSVHRVTGDGRLHDPEAGGLT